MAAPAAGTVLVMTRGTALIGVPGMFLLTSAQCPSDGKLENEAGSWVAAVQAPFNGSLDVSQLVPSSR